MEDSGSPAELGVINDYGAAIRSRAVRVPLGELEGGSHGDLRLLDAEGDCDGTEKHGKTRQLYAPGVAQMGPDEYRY